VAVAGLAAEEGLVAEVGLAALVVGIRVGVQAPRAGGQVLPAGEQAQQTERTDHAGAERRTL
jgi:hypothetical protein